MFRNKKAADDFLELIIYIAILAMILLFFFTHFKAGEKKIIRDSSELDKKSYANNALLRYLDSDASQCLSGISSSESGMLLDKGRLTYADMINIVFIGRLRSSFSHLDFNLDKQFYTSLLEKTEILFFGQDEPYEEYVQIWERCTSSYLNSEGMQNYVIGVYYRDIWVFESISGDYTKSILAGSAAMPNFIGGSETIHVNIYETSYGKS